ncbi:hypothetical protein CDL12_03594 [Handroanthus impetiginosus]|uniref:Uncharacterized protein n=1 Tax=Handroanthus impetiginosus TaxID=429701 RepID=A0A2G9I1P1_9LAMI|nr:hypothetical protein CDL12_03594 [Handroanthus impetiginosus]
MHLATPPGCAFCLCFDSTCFNRIPLPATLVTSRCVISREKSIGENLRYFYFELNTAT